MWAVTIKIQTSLYFARLSDDGREVSYFTAKLLFDDGHLISSMVKSVTGRKGTSFPTSNL